MRQAYPDVTSTAGSLPYLFGINEQETNRSNNSLVTIFSGASQCLGKRARRGLCATMSKIQCVREELLVPAVDAGGLEEMRIIRIGASNYILSVKIKSKRDLIYLSTRRKPDEPRQFKHIEAAATVGHKLFRAKQFTLIYARSRPAASAEKSRVLSRTKQDSKVVDLAQHRAARNLT